MQKRLSRFKCNVNNTQDRNICLQYVYVVISFNYIYITHTLNAEIYFWIWYVDFQEFYKRNFSNSTQHRLTVVGKHHWIIWEFIEAHIRWSSHSLPGPMMTQFSYTCMRYQALFYYYVVYLVPAYRSNHKLCKVWDGVIHYRDFI